VVITPMHMVWKPKSKDVRACSGRDVVARVTRDHLAADDYNTINTCCQQRGQTRMAAPSPVMP
jgi:hypothetical protein